MGKGPKWFAPKRYGYGAGLPISWQGWAVTLGFMAVAVVAVVLLGDRPVAVVAILIPAVLALMLITARTTRGGWRWRWGDDD